MWFYNDKLGKWFHPTGAVSDNGPNDPPAEIDFKAAQTPPKAIPATVATPKPCNCGGVPGSRQVR